MEKLIGREIEKKLLQDAMDSDSPELIALFGRRRVGKTFLIRQFLQKHLVLDFVGTLDANLTVQLENFKKALGKAAGSDKLYQTQNTWPNAFDQLNHYLAPKLAVGKAVVFFDEFPWLNTHYLWISGIVDD
jgi:uncharacterized protein